MEPLGRKDVGDVVAIVDDTTFWLELGEREKEALRPTVTAMMVDGAIAAVETFDLEGGIALGGPVDPAIVARVDTYLDEWWNAVSSTERARLRRSLQQFANGELAGGFPELRANVENIFGRARGRMIAETETTRLWAEGNLVTFEANDVDEYVWRTANDDRVDEICAALNGQIFKVGAGQVPPAHPRCRCAILPVGDRRLR